MTTRYWLRHWNEPHERHAEAAASLAAGLDLDHRAGVDAPLGRLSPAPRLHDDADLDHLQLRTGPLEHLAGAELRIDLTVATAVDDRERCDATVEAARHALSLRAVAARSVADGRRQVRRMLAAIPAHRRPRLLAMGIRAAPTLLTCFDLVVELELLGHGLSPARQRLHAVPGRSLDRGLEDALALHHARAERRDALAAQGRRGFVSEPARRALEFAGMELAVALEHLRGSNALRFVYHLDDGEAVDARLRWKEDLLAADIFPYGARTMLRGDELTVTRSLPESKILSRVGRRIGAIAKDPHVPAAATVIAARHLRDRVQFDLHMNTTPITA